LTQLALSDHTRLSIRRGVELVGSTHRVLVHKKLFASARRDHESSFWPQLSSTRHRSASTRGSERCVQRITAEPSSRGRAELGMPWKPGPAGATIPHRLQKMAWVAVAVVFTGPDSGAEDSPRSATWGPDHWGQIIARKSIDSAVCPWKSQR